MKTSELRIGNLVYCENRPEFVGIPMVVNSISKNSYNGEYYAMITKLNATNLAVAYYPLLQNIQPIPLTEELLLKCGFENIPHFTVTNSKTLDIGRGRFLSIGDVENCNQMMFIQSIYNNKITDLVCVHNYDYDGWLHLHQLQNIYFSLTGEELNINL